MSKQAIRAKSTESSCTESSDRLPSAPMATDLQRFHWRGLEVAYSLGERGDGPGQPAEHFVEELALVGIDPTELDAEFGHSAHRKGALDLFEAHRACIEQAILDDVAQDVADDLIDGDDA